MTGGSSPTAWTDRPTVSRSMLKVWTSMTLAHQFERIVAGGAVTDRIDMGERIAIACALGGPERRTLFLLSSTDAYPQRLIGTRLSRLVAVTVTTPGACLP